MWRRHSSEKDKAMQQQQQQVDGESTPLLSSLKGRRGMIRRRPAPPSSPTTKPTHLSYDYEDDGVSTKKKYFWRQWISTLLYYISIPNHNSDEYYYKEEEEYPKGCSCGTLEEDGIWMNTIRNDWAGVCMSCMVWVAMLYTAWIGTVVIGNTSRLVVQVTLIGFALASHVKTTLTDPGAVPLDALPCPSKGDVHAMCRICRAYKPPFSHHCRICNRCVSRMDHHCPWMNNCIGAANMKFFILFLIYTLLASSTTVIFFLQSLVHYNAFPQSLWTVTAFLVLLASASFVFVGGMLLNVYNGITSGMGTIDRIQHRHSQLKHPKLQYQPVPLTHIFGIQPILTWWLPIDPIFYDTDVILGYTRPQPIQRSSSHFHQHNYTFEDINASFAEV